MTLEQLQLLLEDAANAIDDLIDAAQLPVSRDLRDIEFHIGRALRLVQAELEPKETR